jgi:hypothetical protein
MRNGAGSVRLSNAAGTLRVGDYLGDEQAGEVAALISEKLRESRMEGPAAK